MMGGTVYSIGGTSASTPAFAAIVSLLNEARLNGSKKQMISSTPSSATTQTLSLTLSLASTSSTAMAMLFHAA